MCKAKSCSNIYGIHKHNNNNNVCCIQKNLNDEVHSLYLYDFLAYLIGLDQVVVVVAVVVVVVIVVVVVVVPDDGRLNNLKYVVEIQTVCYLLIKCVFLKKTESAYIILQRDDDTEIDNNKPY